MVPAIRPIDIQGGIFLIKNHTHHDSRRELLPEMGELAAAVKEVYFYGAGCLGNEICGNVASAIRAVFTAAERIEADTDLLGAARALCGHRPGIACILGTGSKIGRAHV